nr:MAG TPA: hypothetical protein [Caudoviricetes sp.]
MSGQNYVLVYCHDNHLENVDHLQACLVNGWIIRAIDLIRDKPKPDTMAFILEKEDEA